MTSLYTNGGYVTHHTALSRTMALEAYQIAQNRREGKGLSPGLIDAFRGF